MLTVTKICPKCGGEMVSEDYLSGYGAVRLVKFGDIRGDKVIPFYCKNCGYIELYNEKNLKK
jgi:predicted nucleic-acid-binding Zn-ribbon protein